MNDMMSLRIHRLWKDYFVENLRVGRDSQIVDVAGGTGDISFRAMKRMQRSGGSGSVTVIDINQARRQADVYCSDYLHV